jgi:hypothetical protein
MKRESRHARTWCWRSSLFTCCFLFCSGFCVALMACPEELKFDGREAGTSVEISEFLSPKSCPVCRSGVSSFFRRASTHLFPRSAPHTTPHLKKWITAQQKPTSTRTPPQKTHLSCFARRSTIRIVSPLTPSVFATPYNRFCVPFSISLCWPRSPSTARPRSRYSSSVALVVEKKLASRRA